MGISGCEQPHTTADIYRDIQRLDRDLEVLALIDAAASADLGEFTLEPSCDFPIRMAAVMMASTMVGME
jgi:hypothetical protein